jgi:RNA polymerase sigma-70 factor (ECF subfamily)
MHAPDPSRVSNPDDLVRHGRFVKALARELARDDSEADELAARTMAEAVARRPGGGPSLRVWLRRVLWRIFRRERRDEERRRRATDSLKANASGGDSAPATVDLVARIELEETVAAAYAALDEPCKSTLFLRFYDDRSPSEIAAQTGTPVETVKTRLKRGLERLRERLDAHADQRAAARGDWRAVAIALAKQGGPVVAIAKAKGLAAAAVVVAFAGLMVWKFNSRRAPEIAPSTVANSKSQDEVDLPIDAVSPDDPVAAAENEAPSRVAEPPPARFASGRVVDEDGRPIAGARVVASVLVRAAPLEHFFCSSGLERSDLEQRTVARSGADGQFVVAPAPDDVVGFYFVAEDHVTASWFDLSAEAAANQDHRVELACGCVLRGRVLDQEESPIFDAAVGASDPLQESETRTARNLEGAPTYHRVIPQFPSVRCSTVDGRHSAIASSSGRTAARRDRCWFKLLLATSTSRSRRARRSKSSRSTRRARRDPASPSTSRRAIAGGRGRRRAMRRGSRASRRSRTASFTWSPRPISTTTPPSEAPVRSPTPHSIPTTTSRSRAASGGASSGGSSSRST